MKKTTLFSVILILVFLGKAVGQQHPVLKGSGERFFYEDFNWGDPTDPK